MIRNAIMGHSSANVSSPPAWSIVGTGPASINVGAGSLTVGPGTEDGRVIIGPVSLQAGTYDLIYLGSGIVGSVFVSPSSDASGDAISPVGVNGAQFLSNGDNTALGIIVPTGGCVTIRSYDNNSSSGTVSNIVLVKR